MNNGEKIILYRNYSRFRSDEMTWDIERVKIDETNDFG